MPLLDNDQQDRDGDQGKSQDNGRFVIVKCAELNENLNRVHTHPEDVWHTEIRHGEDEDKNRTCEDAGKHNGKGDSAISLS